MSIALNWEELSEDVRKNKIDEYINLNLTECENEYRDRNDIREAEDIDIADVKDDPEVKGYVEEKIKNSFPVRF